MKKLLFFLLALSCNLASAQIPKPQKDTYVNDFAQVLSKADIEDLNLKIADIEKTSGVTLAIVLVKKIPANYNIRSFSVAVGQQWQVGDNQSGLVYVAAIQQHQQRIEVARNLDSVFTSEKCDGILQAMKPWFKNKDYAGGLELMVGQIADEYNAPAPVTSTPPAPIVQQPKPAPAKSTEDWPATILSILFIVGVGIGLFKLFATAIRIQRSRKNSGSYMPGAGYPGSPVNRSYSHPSGAGSFIAGAAVGAAAAYAAQQMQDNLSDDSNSDDSSAYADNGDDDNSSGSSWGSSDDSSSNDSSSYDSSSNDSSSYDSSSNDSSSYDSGFSDSGSSDSGATSDW